MKPFLSFFFTIIQKLYGCIMLFYTFCTALYVCNCKLVTKCVCMCARSHTHMLLFIDSSDSPVCPRSASASPLSVCSHRPHRCSERWGVTTSTPDITQRQRRRDSTPVRLSYIHTHKHSSISHSLSRTTGCC